jgi:hypothetical protein
VLLAGLVESTFGCLHNDRRGSPSDHGMINALAFLLVRLKAGEMSWADSSWQFWWMEICTEKSHGWDDML